jgi:hypothetical protein
MKVLLNYGVCLEKFWPYYPHQTDRPKKNADITARQYRIRAYARLKTILEMKRSLVVNGPFLAGVKVFVSWFNPKVSKTGLIPLPKPKEEFAGGHAICIVGYDDSKGLFKFKKPVYFGDTIKCELTINDIDANGFAEANAIFTRLDGIKRLFLAVRESTSILSESPEALIQLELMTCLIQIIFLSKTSLLL